MRYVSPIIKMKDQGNAGFCVGNAFSLMMEIFEMNRLGTEEVPQLSALFLQAECKKIDGSESQGTYSSTAAKVLKNTGICTEKSYPYKITDHVQKLNFPDRLKKHFDEASVRKIKSYTTTKDIESIKAHVFKYGSASMQNNLHHEKHMKNVLVEVGKKASGIHETCIIGFDDDFSYKGFKGAFVRVNTDNTRLQYGLGIEIIPYVFFKTNWFINATLCTPRETSDYLMSKYRDKGIELPLDHVRLRIGHDKVVINGIEKELFQCPVLVDNTTLVPIKLCREAFRKVDLDWDNKNKTASVNDYLGTFYFKIGSKVVTDSRGSIVYTMPVAPTIINNYTMLPLRAFSEVLDARIEYNKWKKEITITR